METRGSRAAALVALVAAASLTPAVVQFFRSCNHGDGPPPAPSRLAQDLGRFRVSSQELVGKGGLPGSSGIPGVSGYRPRRLCSAEAFPIDGVEGDFARTVESCVFSRSRPTPLKGPLRLAAASKVGGGWVGLGCL